jgi:arsenite-transporting ATPase
MALSGLREDALRLILFGGKGGVGKTTCASSTGLFLSGFGKTLILSTDPAHSLSDSLNQPIGNSITPVKGADNLYAMEISAAKALSEFKIEYKEQIQKILDTSTYFDNEDIDSLFALPIPGIDEVMGFKTIVEMIEKKGFSKYVVDTAPTGHALRLLALPGLLDDWIKVLAKMRWKYRYMIESFKGEYRPDEADDFLVEMKKTVRKIEGLLRDRRQCEFIVVAEPEEMVILESRRLVEGLKSYGVEVNQLVVNNVVQDCECGFCRERRRVQQKHMDRIRHEFRGMKPVVVPQLPKEVRGLDALNEFRKLLFEA